jgi:hypothetical protein
MAESDSETGVSKRDYPQDHRHDLAVASLPLAARQALAKATFTGSSHVDGMSLTPARNLGRPLGQKIISLRA